MIAVTLRRLISRYGWQVALVLTGLGIIGCAWLVFTDAPAYRFVLRLYRDKAFLKQVLQERGIVAPLVFVAIQAVQVIISPIPGEATGFLGGYLFGKWLGFLYSSIGLTLGSMGAFAAGRWFGAHTVRSLVSKEAWQKLGLIVEAEGAILCFIIYLIPGLPKDIACYIFGISPMPFWVFTLVSGLGRMPGTWVLSAQGDSTATGHYVQAILITAVAVAVGLPLYYYRHRIVRWLRGREEQRSAGREPRSGA